MEAKLIKIEEGKLLAEKRPTQEAVWQEFLEGWDAAMDEAKGELPVMITILSHKYKIRKCIQK